MTDDATEPQSQLSARLLRAGAAATLVLLVLAMYPHVPEPTKDAKTLLAHGGAGLLVFGWLAWRLGSRRPASRGLALMDVLLLAFAAVYLAAALASDYRARALVETARFASLGLFYYVVSQVYRRPDRVRPLLAAYCAAVALSSLYAAAQWAGYDPFPWSESSLTSKEYAQLPGTLGNPNIAGHALVPAILIAGYLGWRPRWRWALLLVPVYLAHLYATGHRGGVLALAGGVAVAGTAFVLKRLGAPGKKRLLTAWAVIVLLGALAAMAGLAYSKATSGRWLPLDSSLLLRYNSFYGAARMAVDRPLLGFGPDAYVVANPPYWTAYEQEHYVNAFRINAHPHNEYLMTAIDAGLPALFLYVAILVFAMSAALDGYFRLPPGQGARLRLLFCAAFAAFAVDGLFGFNLRAVVSSVFAAYLLGAMTGVDKGELPARRSASAERLGLAWKTAVAVLALVNVLTASRVFYAQVLEQKGRSAANWGAPAQANHLLAQAGRLAPWNWQTWVWKGYAQLEAGDMQGAAGDFEQALRVNPHSLSAWIGLGRARFNRAMAEGGSYEPAMEAAERVRALCRHEPAAEDLTARIILARLNRDSDTLPPAAREKALAQAETRLLNAISASRGGDGERWRLLGQLYRLRGALDEAESALVKAAGLEPEDPACWRDLLELARRTADPSPMRAALQDAAGEAEPPVLAELSLWRARLALEVGGDPGEAMEAYAGALAHDVTRLDVWGEFTQAARQNGREAFFRETLLGVAADDGAEAPPAVGVLDALWRGALAGGLEEAAGRLSLIYKEFREAGASKDLLQEQLLWAAGWVLEPLLERAPGNDAAVALLNLGDVCARLDAPAWGEAAAIRAAAVFSPGTDDWKRAVQVLHRAGALEEATAVAERGLAAKPQDPAMLVLLADLYAEAGKAGPAAQLYRRALQAPGIGPKTRAAIEERLQRTREQAEIPPAAP